MAFTLGFSTLATIGRLYTISGQALCVVTDEAGPRVPVGPAGDDAIFLGELDGEPCFACAFGDAPPEGAVTTPLRQLFSALPDIDFAIAGRALGLLAWDRDHRFCGRCGGETVRSASERVRTCTRCGHGAYPRLSPAIIVLVERDGRALLARNARATMPFHSTLAGFVEVGETLEEAVAREVREEVGIDVGEVRYFGSQPWPFTGSLMVGFTARWTGGELTPDPSEVFDAGWFAPSDMPPVPPRLSIARELIDDFLRRNG